MSCCYMLYLVLRSVVLLDEVLLVSLDGNLAILSQCSFWFVHFCSYY